MGRLFNTGTLQSRLTALLIVLVFMATGLVALLALYLAEDQMQEVVGNQQQALLTSVAAYIDQDLQDKRLLLAGLAEQLPRQVIANPTQLQAVLEPHSTLRSEFFNVVAFDARGELIASLNERNAIGTLNVAEREYFQDTIAAHEGVVSRPFKSKLSGKPVVLVTEPVYNEAGELAFVLAGGIDLQQPTFFGQLEALKPGDTGYLFIITTDGLIVHHPDRERLLRNVKEEPGGPVPATLAALHGAEGWSIGKSKKGVRSLLTYKRLRATDWIVGAVYPVSEAFTPLIQMRRKALVASAAVAVLAGLIGWLATLRLLRPFGALRRHVAELSAGGTDISVFNVDRRDEFGDLSRAFYGLSQQRAHAREALEAQARTDALTGLNNRRMFHETFDAAIARARRTRTLLALGYLDIDHFKRINDTHGHGIGDRVLVEFSQRLKLAVRGTDTVARLAGDEFVVIFENLADAAQPSVMGSKILEAMGRPFVFGELTLRVSTSIGLALGGAEGASVEQYLATADAALYAAKDAGRGRYSVRRVDGGEVRV